MRQKKREWQSDAAKTKEEKAKKAKTKERKNKSAPTSWAWAPSHAREKTRTDGALNDASGRTKTKSPQASDVRAQRCGDHVRITKKVPSIKQGRQIKTHHPHRPLRALENGVARVIRSIFSSQSYSSKRAAVIVRVGAPTPPTPTQWVVPTRARLT
ncbi:hypothetical protein C8F04DRAFT_1080189 [Mycena alexandri]|uniref:Uncharacterized protein n=1 Tax=Mycena alexandri TaxID=1745969 RepID=A0AAD6T773_9AGAR|nr:hypothetical protein C8F04DRAFT_1080189 [Mycena alexandri]